MELELLIRVFEKHKNGPLKIMLKDGEFMGQWRYFTKRVEYYSPAVSREVIPLEPNDIPETMGLFSGAFDGTKWDELEECEQLVFLKNIHLFKSFIGVKDCELSNINMKSVGAFWCGKLIFDGDVFDSTVHIRSTGRNYTRTFLASVFSPLHKRSVELYRDYKDHDDDFKGIYFGERETGYNDIFTHSSNSPVKKIGNRYENPGLVSLFSPCDNAELEIYNALSSLLDKLEEHDIQYSLILEMVNKNGAYTRSSPFKKAYPFDLRSIYDSDEIHNAINTLVGLALCYKIKFKYEAVVALTGQTEILRCIELDYEGKLDMFETSRIVRGDSTMLSTYFSAVSVPWREIKDSQESDTEECVAHHSAEEISKPINKSIEYQGVAIKIFDVKLESGYTSDIRELSNHIVDARREYISRLEYMKERTLESPESEFCFPLTEEEFIAIYLNNKNVHIANIKEPIQRKAKWIRQYRESGNIMFPDYKIPDGYVCSYCLKHSVVPELICEGCKSKMFTETIDVKG